MGVAEAVAAMGPGSLAEQAVQQYLRPLFSQSLAEGGLYLAGHTLGRMLNQSADDVTEGMAAWSVRQRDAWEPWLGEEQRYRAAVAALLGLLRVDCVVPKASAGQALRAVLNTLPPGATVLTTRGEFASVTAVLERYAAMSRVRVRYADAEADGRWTAECVLRSLSPETQLVVVSHVFYADAQVFDGLDRLAAGCRQAGARLLVDAYHSVGVLPFSFAQIGCDYLIGGCYKYLRGGPGAAFLVLAPKIADSAVQTLDTGWFAGKDGGDAWLEATPAVLTYYQARSGLALTRALGVERLRTYSQRQLASLHQRLSVGHVDSRGADDGHGAFLTIACTQADAAAAELARQGVVVDAREGRIRVCPDLLTTKQELLQAGDAISGLLA